MGNSKSTRKDSRDRAIDRQLNEARRQDEATIKLLLLGTGDSGKSTIMKQWNILYGDGYSDDSRQGQANGILRNFFDDMLVLSASVTTVMGKEFESESSAAAVQHLRDIEESDNIVQMDGFTEETAQAMITLWNDPAVQFAWENRSRIQVTENCSYFAGNICGSNTYMRSGWLPSIHDMILARVRTSGIIENDFTVGGVRIKVVDVGGQRNERRKWIHCFENVTSILFVVSTSEYDEVLFEDRTTNRLQESFQLFSEMQGLSYFRDASFILFLNKKDLLEDKLLNRNIPIPSAVFPDAPQRGSLSDEEYLTEVQKWIGNQYQNRFERRNKSQLYTHYTCATDTNNMDALFNAIKDTILKSNLMSCGFMDGGGGGGDNYSAGPAPTSSANEDSVSMSTPKPASSASPAAPRATGKKGGASRSRKSLKQKKAQLPAEAKLVPAVMKNKQQEMKSEDDVAMKEYEVVGAVSEGAVSNSVTPADVVVNDAAPIRQDLAYFSAFAPPEVGRGAEFLLNIWAFIKEERDDIIAQEKVKGNTEAGVKGPLRIRDGQVIGIKLDLDEKVFGYVAGVNDTAEMEWCGAATISSFAIKSLPKAKYGMHVCKATISIDGLNRGVLIFQIKVSSSVGSKQNVPASGNGTNTNSSGCFPCFGGSQRPSSIPRRRTTRVTPQADLNAKLTLLPPSKEPHIFLSYRRTQIDLADRVRRVLRDLGYNCFLDLSHENGLEAGPYVEQLRAKLEQARVVIPLLTPAPSGQDAPRSELSSLGCIKYAVEHGTEDWCHYELNLALHDKSKLVLPLFRNVNLDEEFANLPKDIESLRDMNCREIHDDLFDQSIEVAHKFIQKKLIADEIAS